MKINGYSYVIMGRMSKVDFCGHPTSSLFLKYLLPFPIPLMRFRSQVGLHFHRPPESRDVIASIPSAFAARGQRRISRLRLKMRLFDGGWSGNMPKSIKKGTRFA